MTYDPTNPDSINPRKWNRRKAFYFDGDIALMLGKYDGAEEECLGMRWMQAEGPQGYPVSRGYPQWLVTPDKLARYMLEGIQRNRAQEAENICDVVEFQRALTVIGPNAGD